MTDAPTPTAAAMMSRHVHCLQPEMPLSDVVRFLLEHEVSNAPVVDGTGVGHRLVGFVSERDCLAALADESYFGSPRPPQTAATIMRRHPVCVAPDAELFALSSIFTNHGFRHLPVTEEGNLLGIVSRRDVLKAMDECDERISADGGPHVSPDPTLLENLRFIASR